MKNILITFIFLSLIMMSCSSGEKNELLSPNRNISVLVDTDENGELFYQVYFAKKQIVSPSKLSFTFQNASPFKSNLTIETIESRYFNQDWEMLWGEQVQVKNKFNENSYIVKEDGENGRKIKLEFRAFNDGVAYRYHFLEEGFGDTLIITSENSAFNFTEDYTCFWIPGDWEIYEHLYNTTKLSEIDAISKRNHPNLAQSVIPENAVNTPVTMRGEDGIHISLHEANLTDYAGMTLKLNEDKTGFVSELVGSDRMGYKVKRAIPFNTPWRTIMITDNAPALIDSKMIVNLNEPSKRNSIPWFKPMKYVGIWWEMHLDKSSWDMASGKHGATTENAKKYIDFAAENGFGGVLIEGWNTGWERWIGFEDREGVFDFITPYPDYDLEEVVSYAKLKGVEIIMHHETSAAPRTYDQQLDAAYDLMEKLEIHVVKTGYVGPIIPKGEYHHGQWMVNHYRRVLEKGLEKKVAINAHEPIKATGLRRTYPNAISREGLRGQEFNAWASDGGNPPEHIPIVAFTRMLAGPIDFTPGAFNIKLDGYKEENQINTTLAQQLAMYVVIYSPIQMACDLPEHYEGQPAFQFIKDVGVDWKQSIVLNGEVGDYVTIARQEKGTGNWFIGGLTDENEREFEISFDFLDKNKKYKAIIYRDGEEAHWNDNPLDIVIEEKILSKEDKLVLRMASGGGFAISLKEIEKE